MGSGRLADYSMSVESNLLQGPPPHPASVPRLAWENQFNSALARLRALRRMLPADFPDWRTCYKYFRQWSERPDPAKYSILEQVLKKIG